ncbi:MAG TPA: YdcF family protein [Bacteroidales bacterium]|nr:YdcF family protein [Bacteroidales bacterium]
MKRLLWFLGFLLLVAVLSVVGCRNSGTWLAREDIPPHADAMVLLMGPFPERVLQAADLYNQGVADGMIIVYESMGPYQLLEARGAAVVRTTEQARDAAMALGMPDSCITMLPGDARSTLDEALAVRDYISGKPGLDTLILVSSPAHMGRSYIIFRTVLHEAGINACIGTSPSKYSSFRADRWWRQKEDIQSVLSEWMKIVSFVIYERRKAV